MNRVKPRVLVVEDEPTLNLAICKLFEHWGFDPVQALTAAEAVDSLSIVFDLVVLDLMLPDGDGTVVLEAIRGRSIDVPVAVSTALPQDSPRLDAVRAFKPAYLLIKPMALAALEAVAADVRERFVQSRIPRP